MKALWLVAIVAALRYSSGYAVAQEIQVSDLPVTIDHAWLDGDRFNIVARVKNGGAVALSSIRIECDIFDDQGKALGEETLYVRSLPAGKTGVADTMILLPPDTGQSKVDPECRTIEAFPD